MKRAFGATLLVLFVFSFAQGADFLRSARGGGLGFSYFLLADDPSGALYNPSALGYLKGWQTQMMYEKMSDYDYQISPEKPYMGQLGLLYYRPYVGTFALNTLQSGSFAELTNVATVNHAALSYGRQMGRLWSVGGSIKYLSEMGFGERSAFDLDLAASYRSPGGVFAAAALENAIRSKMSPDYLGVSEYLPRRTRLGTGYYRSWNTYQGALLLAGQLEESGFGEKTTTSLFNVASEWWFLQNKAFSFGTRAGYSFGESSQYGAKADYASPSGGVSFDYKFGPNSLRLDYGYQAYPFDVNGGSASGNHFVSMSIGWGGRSGYSASKRDEAPRLPKPKKEPPKPKIFQEPKAQQTERAPIDNDTNFKDVNYRQFEVEMEASDISSMDLKRIVFYVRPQQVIKTTSWKLYVFKAKIKSWSEEEAERWALATIEGKGVPPINIVWDGKDLSGEYVDSGKYYYLLTAVDVKGQNYATEWFNFKLE